MTIRSAKATLDIAYRQVVRSAAGDDYLRRMTETCLRAVEALGRRDAQPTAADANLGRELHRLAGGTAAVGLAALAASLRALENSCQSRLQPGELDSLWQSCRASVQDCRAALSSEGS